MVSEKVPLYSLTAKGQGPQIRQQHPPQLTPPLDALRASCARCLRGLSSSIPSPLRRSNAKRVMSHPNEAVRVWRQPSSISDEVMHEVRHRPYEVCSASLRSLFML